MTVGNLNLTGRALLAPLAGVSNRPFRVLAISAGAAMAFTEMVSADGIVRSQAKTLAMMRFKPDEQPIGIQLFGADPAVMHEAAAITVERFRPDLIDINLGCPVKKVVRKNGGAALLKDIGLTRRVIRAVVTAAGTTPVSVKMRSGWEQSSPVYIEVARLAEEEGVSAVTLHARSRSCGFAGRADWSAIARLKSAVSIPVIGNGDIRVPEDARRMLEETGCDSVMVGRAAMTDPLIFRRINQLLSTGVEPAPPTIPQIVELALVHARLMRDEYGEQRGMRMMRRYLGWQVRGIRGAAKLRPLLFRVETLRDIERIFERYLGAGAPEPSAPPEKLRPGA
ncbi:MAG TPA: tRNA dihydrouridine synthase DusB [Acidobacteriota bacterium]|nr:tRNA dihydrouridine synthase DusB [Acidobacteriota bacterium]